MKSPKAKKAERDREIGYQALKDYRDAVQENPSVQWWSALDMIEDLEEWMRYRYGKN